MMMRISMPICLIASHCKFLFPNPYLPMYPVVQSSVGYQNPMAVLPPTGMIASTPAMFFFSARYAVDTFFFIGGYLVMSGMLKVSLIAQCLSGPPFDYLFGPIGYSFYADATLCPTITEIRPNGSVQYQ